MYDNLSKVLQEANEMVNHYNQLNQLAQSQLKEITELKAEIERLTTDLGEKTERSRP